MSHQNYARKGFLNGTAMRLPVQSVDNVIRQINRYPGSMEGVKILRDDLLVIRYGDAQEEAATKPQ